MLKKIVIGLIKSYQRLTGFIPHNCRFYPSCSQYMIEALKKYGLIKGLMKGLGRIMRCHPGNPGGVDYP